MPRSRPGPRKRPHRDEEGVPPGTWQARLRLWIDIKGHGTLGPGKLRLLEAIAVTNSLSAAARELGMSYRLAWERLRLLEKNTGLTVVEPRRGGRSGGGTTLTPRGQALLEAYRDWRSEVEAQALDAFGRHFRHWSSPGARKS